MVLNCIYPIQNECNHCDKQVFIEKKYLKLCITTFYQTSARKTQGPRGFLVFTLIKPDMNIRQFCVKFGKNLVKLKDIP